MNINRLNALVHELNRLQPQHERLTAMARDTRQFLSSIGVTHAKAALKGSTFTITNLKAAIVAELGD